MNKKELIGEVSRRTGVLKKDAGAIIETALQSIADTLAKDEKVQLAGFGTFEVRTRVARNCRNPRTKEIIRLDSMRLPAFKAGKILKQAVAQNSKE